MPQLTEMTVWLILIGVILRSRLAKAPYRIDHRSIAPKSPHEHGQMIAITHSNAHVDGTDIRAAFLNVDALHTGVA